MPARKDYTGLQKGRLTIIKDGPDYQDKKQKRRTFICKCECGNTKQILGNLYLAGRILSCGCLRKETSSNTHKKHGFSTHPEFPVWSGIKARCYNKNSTSYKHYGARNIKMCPEWLNSFEQFLKDMGPRPSKNHSIERIDINKDYTPDNCVWLLKKLQPRNTRKSVLTKELATHIKELAKQNLSVKEISEKLSISYNNVYNVVKNITWKNA